jgi:uncharacterized membrane protein
MMVQGVFFAPAIMLYGWATGALIVTPAIVWGLAAGFSIYLALYHFARSLAGGSASIIAPIFRLNFIITAALAIVFLDEPLTYNKLAGLALALAAVWLLLGSDDRASRRMSRSALIRVLVATFAIALTNFFYKLGVAAGATPAAMLAGQASVFFPLAVIIVWISDRNLTASRAAWRHAPFAALFLLIGFMLLLESLRHGEASVLLPIGQMGFIVTALCGMVFLRELFTLRKLAGLAAAVGALVMLAHG